MNATADVTLAIAEGIATIRLRNPARRNAISTPMWQQIAAHAAAVAQRPDVRVVLVRGDGTVAFSAGADITDFESARSGDRARAYDDIVEDSCRAVETLPQPTVALIFGACAGGAATLAASCDLRVAADDAFFMAPAARLGLGYDPRQVVRMTRAFGAAATRQLLLTGDRLPAARAHALGLVHLLVPAAEAEAAAGALVRRIAANAPLTLRAAKTALRGIAEGDDALMREAERLAAAADASNDYGEGRRAFAEQRAPRFTGR